MISFTAPIFLLLLFGLPLYLILYRLSVFQKVGIPLTLSDWNGRAFKWHSSRIKIIRWLAGFFCVVGYIFAVIAGAGPVKYIQEKLYAGKGAGIIIAVDVSPSMAARDMDAETRLDVAKKAIKEFAKNRAQDSIGLVAFGSDAALLVPPSLDRATFFNRLNALTIGELGEGTAIGLALTVAAANLAHTDFARSSVILLTDGENNAGEIHPKTAASLYDTYGISLYVTGVGKKGDVPIDYVDSFTGKRVSGILSSDFNELALKNIADIAHGVYFSASDLVSLNYVFSLAEESLPPVSVAWTQTKEITFVQPLLLLALVSFSLSWVLRRLVLGAII